MAPAASASASAPAPTPADVSDQPSFADLPEEAVACILQHVPWRQRLPCILVCRSWAAAAAAAAPADISVKISPSNKQLQSWLSRPSARVASISAVGPGICWPRVWSGKGLLQLPCHGLDWLTELRLFQMETSLLQHVPARVDGDAAGMAAAYLPRLRALSLVDVVAPSQLLLQLAQLTGLTRLKLMRLRVYNDTPLQPIPLQLGQAGIWLKPLSVSEQAAATAQLLRHLTGLSELCCDVCTAAAEVVDATSSMQRLQHLQLVLKAHVNAAATAALPISLTHLHLAQTWAVTASYSSIISAAAQLSRLTNLQQLRAANMRMKPDALSDLTCLQVLHLEKIQRAPEPAPASDACLLMTLACLAQLQHLELRDCSMSVLLPQHDVQEQENRSMTPVTCLQASQPPAS